MRDFLAPGFIEIETPSATLRRGAATLVPSRVKKELHALLPAQQFSNC
jgi:hypothetical protein